MSGGGTASVQVRNPEMVDLLSTDFVRRNESTLAWGKVMSMFQMLPGLRGLWSMSSVNESGNALDLSGQGRTLSYNGNPTYNVSGLVPYIDLDGAGDYLSRADEAGLRILGTETIYAAALRGLTVGGWFYPTANATDEGLISKWVAAGNQRSFMLKKSAANARDFSITTDGATVVSASGGTITMNTWHYIVGRFDPSTELAAWLDNVKVTNGAGIPASIFNSNSAFEIGRYDAGNAFNGNVSVGFLCATALPDRIITALYEHTRTWFGV